MNKIDINVANVSEVRGRRMRRGAGRGGGGGKGGGRIRGHDPKKGGNHTNKKEKNVEPVS